jgi:hypothetical protein
MNCSKLSCLLSLPDWIATRSGCEKRLPFGVPVDRAVYVVAIDRREREQGYRKAVERLNWQVGLVVSLQLKRVASAP